MVPCQPVALPMAWLFASLCLQASWVWVGSVPQGLPVARSRQCSKPQYSSSPTHSWLRLCGDLIYHLALCATLQEKGALNTAWSNQCFRLVGSDLSPSPQGFPNVQWQLFAGTENTDNSLSKKVHQSCFHLLVDPYEEENIVLRRRTLEELKVSKNLSRSQATPKVTFWACFGTFLGEGSSGVGPLGHPGHHYTGAQCASQTRAVVC